MRNTQYSPTVRRRRLGMQLRRMRNAAGYNLGDAAHAVGISQAALGKIETSETKRVALRQVEALAELYKAPDDQARALAQLARDAGHRGWWVRYRDVFGRDALPDFEAEASIICTHQVAVVPGLLQIPEYSEAIFRAGPVTTDDEIAHHVEARMGRRDILHRIEDPPHLWAIIDETALRRPIGSPETMRAQLSYLLRVGQHPNVDIQILPLKVGAYPNIGVPFTILEFPEPLDPTIVYSDAVESGQFEEDQGVVTEYSQTFRHLQSIASTTVESARWVESIREEIE